MANEENLMAHRIREPEEARQKGKSGGRKSGEVRRRKKAFRDAATDIIRTVITDPMLLEKVSKQGYEKENMTYQEAMVAGMVYSAICGSPQAYKAIKDTVEPDGLGAQNEALERIDGIIAELDIASRESAEDESGET